MNPYAILGIGVDADDAKITAAYRAQAVLWHPDKFTDKDEKAYAEIRMREINEAHSMLTDKSKRQDLLFLAVRDTISHADFKQAASMLKTAPDVAEKYFLTGVIAMKKCEFFVAQESVKFAIELNPRNEEYKRTYYALMGRSFPKGGK